MNSKTSIVLVHGGFVDGSGWQDVYHLLVAEGHEVPRRAEPDYVAGG